MVVRMAAKRKQRIAIHSDGEFRVLDIGQIEIWDGADLALLRDSMTDVICKGATHIGVEMRAVKYIPSGFFGMLHDWHERGISVRLYSPQRNVQTMLWFRQFCDHLGDGCFLILSEPKHEMKLSPKPEWDEEPVWENAKSEEPLAPSVEVDDGEWSAFRKK